MGDNLTRLLFLALLFCIQFLVSGSPPTEEDQPPSEERVALAREAAERGHGGPDVGNDSILFYPLAVQVHQ